MGKEKVRRRQGSAPKAAVATAENGPGQVETIEVRRAIADGFGEYRRMIAGVRSRHGRRSRRSLLN